MFSINDGHSNALSAGIQTETEARNIAARTADERGESVWLSGPGIEGEEEIAPDGQGEADADERASVRCVSDRYDRDGGAYAGTAEFDAMCLAAFGEAPALTEQADGWHDDQGLVLVRA